MTPWASFRWDICKLYQHGLFASVSADAKLLSNPRAAIQPVRSNGPDEREGGDGDFLLFRHGRAAVKDIWVRNCLLPLSPT
jgi:hypothetical protein